MGSNFPSPLAQRTLIVPPGHAAFRLLCPASRIGGFIRDPIGIIKALRQCTSAKIQIEEAPDDCPDRVITVTAPAKIDTAIGILEDAPADLCGDLGEETEVSLAQEALLGVFETILVAATKAEGPAADDGVVSCRILVEKNQGRKVVAEIKKESRCKIQVLVDNLPACANPGEEMIEIEGCLLGVKIALVSTAKRLQEWPPFDKTRISRGYKNVESSQHQSLDFSADLSRKDPTLHATTSTSSCYTSGFDPPLYETAGVVLSKVRPLRRSVSFRILCPSDQAGGVIGKGGTNVRTLEKETGASISVGSIEGRSDLRIITVSAWENQDSRFSPAREAAIRVYSRLVEISSTNDQDPVPCKDKIFIAKLVVPSSNVGCLIGTGGSIVSELRSVTGTTIWILKGGSECAFENDGVVEVSGKFSSVRGALYAIMGTLREKIFLSSRSNTTIRSSLEETSPHSKMKDPAPLGLDSLALSPCHRRYSAVTQRTHDHVGVMHNADDSVSRRLEDSRGVSGSSHRAVNDVGKGSEFRSGTKLVATNMTVEIVVPEELIHSVYGEIGQNLDCVRLISGAMVTIHEPLAGKSERTVVISGTTDEVQAAQSILHAFILTASYRPSTVAT